VFGREKIDRPPRRRPVGNPELRIPRGGTVGRSFSLPTRKNFRMLGHTGAIVVFDFIINGHGSTLGNFRTADIGGTRLCVRSKWRYLLAMKIECRQMRKAVRAWH